jgi:GNAT superfamily N-acetyltransferase
MYHQDYPLCADEDLFKWQFGGPGSFRQRDGFHVKLALVGDRIAGCLGYIPVELSLGEEIVPAAWTANWMVDPADRRLGLGPLLMRELTREFTVTLVVGLSSEARTLLPRMGWTEFDDLGRFVCVLDPEAAGKLTDSGRLEWPAEALRRGGGSGWPAKVTCVSRFGAAVTAFWDRICATGPFAGTRRSAEFLNWRYAEHPSASYRLFEAHRDGALSGFAVYRVEPVRGVPVVVGRLVELVSMDLGEELVQAVLEDARLQGVVALDFFCSAREAGGVLERNGFLPPGDPASGQVPMLFQPIDRRRKGIPFMAYLANAGEKTKGRPWYVTKGDGDQDRPN